MSINNLYHSARPLNLSSRLSLLLSGEYRVGIKFNDQHIPDSPHKVYISPAMGDAHKLEVAQFPDSGVQTDKPYTFLVRKNGAKGELDGKVNPILSLLLFLLGNMCAIRGAVTSFA